MNSNPSTTAVEASPVEPARRIRATRRANCAPAFYLNRPAAVWQAALSRRHRAGVDV